MLLVSITFSNQEKRVGQFFLTSKTDKSTLDPFNVWARINGLAELSKKIVCLYI